MAITMESNVVRFDAVVYEDEVPSLRDYLQEAAPEKVEFDFTACDDVHLAVLQVVLAYKKLYECDFRFGEEKKMFQMVLEGFDSVENHSS